MEQYTLFNLDTEQKQKLDTKIERKEDKLLIPEGLNTTPCTHGLHRFAGKFIPNLVRYIIRNEISNDSSKVILDPFCGSGTTLVEAALEGRKYVGLDIDPLSVAISKAKTTVLSTDELHFIAEYWNNFNYDKKYVELIPVIPNLNHWFTEQAINELSAIKNKCLQLPERLKSFCLIVFSSIIRRVSNADDQTQKTYVSHTLPKKPPLPSKLFPVFLKRALDGMKDFYSLIPMNPNGNIFKYDSALGLQFIDFDDVITSPPYIDSIDYVYNQMLEYYWLLDELEVYTHENYRQLRKEAMGFRLNKNQDLYSEFLYKIDNFGSDNFENICKKIKQDSPKEELIVRSFFADYLKHVTMIRQRQKTGSKYISVVGNSVIRKIEVPTIDLIIDIHNASGYQLVDSYNYEIKRHYMKFPRKSNSGKIKTDQILIFKAI